MQRTKLKDRILPTYTKGEEIFNMTSHIVGAVLGVVATVLCIVFAGIHKNVYGIISGAIYGVTMIVLYTIHYLPSLGTRVIYGFVCVCVCVYVCVTLLAEIPEKFIPLKKITVSYRKKITVGHVSVLSVGF